MLPAAAIFDLDGTLVDTERLWVLASAATVRRLGGDLSDAESERIVYGRAWKDVGPDLLRRIPESGLDLGRLREVCHVELERFKAKSDIRIHGSLNLLRALHAAGLPCAIASGSRRADIEWAVAHTAIADCLRLIVGDEDYPRGKPDPAPYLTACERLGADPAACIACEDSEVGTRSARVAGLRVLGLARPEAPRQDLSAAHRVVPDFAPLASLSPAELWAWTTEASS